LYNTFLFENPVVYEIMWKNFVERGKSQMTIWRMRIACWVAKATNTHSEYVILIAFPLQQWLRERASLLLYTYIACLVTVSFYHSFLNAVLNQAPSCQLGAGWEDEDHPWNLNICWHTGLVMSWHVHLCSTMRRKCHPNWSISRFRVLYDTFMYIVALRNNGSHLDNYSL